MNVGRDGRLITQLGREKLESALVSDKVAFVAPKVELYKVGMVFAGGLNPVAGAVEPGIEVDNDAMSTVMEYHELIKFWEL